MSSCFCEDPCDVWTEKERRARKEHRCYECDETIKRGELYTYISALYDGSWDHYNLCEYCSHDWKVLTSLGYCKLVGGLEETWQEAHEESVPVEPLRPLVSEHGAWPRTLPAHGAWPKTRTY